MLALLVAFSGSAMAQYQVNGTAVATSCNCYVLTPAQNTSSGSVWNVNLIDLTNSFDFEFEVFLGNNNSGADGMVFGLQPNGTSVGTNGGGMGLGGVVPSLGVYMDTYQNGGAGDPFSDHISINSNGDVNHGTANNLDGPFNVANMEDGNWHDLHVVWDAGTQTLTAEFDGVPAVSYTGNIVANIFGGNPQVYWGFTAATGGLNNLQQVCTQLNPDISVPSTTACVTDSVHFTNSSTTFGGLSSINWDFGDGNTSTANDPVHLYNAPGTYNVKLVVADNSGCADSTVTPITVVAIPNAGIGGPLAICGNATPFDMWDELTGGALATGTWSGPVVLGGGHLATFDPLFDPPGYYEYVVLGGGNCPNDTSGFQVTLGSQPNGGLDGTPLTFCSSDPDSSLFGHLGGTPDSTGVWSGPSALGGGHNAVFNPSQSLAGTYTYTVAGIGCPDSSASIDITVNQQPDAGGNSSAFPCIAGGAINLFQYLGGTPETGGQWLMPDLTPIGMPVDPTTIPNGLYSYVVGIPGCLDSAQLGLTITAPPFAGVSTTLTVCADVPPFQLHDTLPGGPDGGGTWYDPLGNATILDFNPASSLPGTYTYVVQGNAPCVDDSATVDIAVAQLPIPAFTIDETDGCSPVVSNFTITNDSLTIADWEWDFSGGRTSEEWAPQMRFGLPVCYDVSLWLETHHGCSHTTVVPEAVCARALPIADFNWLPEMPTVLDPTVRFWDQSERAVNWRWVFDDLGSTSDQLPEWEFPADPGDHEVCQIVYTDFGCTDTLCQELTIEGIEDIFVPNAFTPDGDGMNDRFAPVLNFTPTLYEFYIYNRWGELLFHSKALDQGWNGIYAGNYVQSGGYTWRLEVESHEMGYNVIGGKVMVVR